MLLWLLASGGQHDNHPTKVPRAAMQARQADLIAKAVVLWGVVDVDPTAVRAPP